MWASLKSIGSGSNSDIKEETQQSETPQSENKILKGLTSGITGAIKNAFRPAGPEIESDDSEDEELEKQRSATRARRERRLRVMEEDWDSDSQDSEHAKKRTKSETLPEATGSPFGVSLPVGSQIVVPTGVAAPDKARPQPRSPSKFEALTTAAAAVPATVASTGKKNKSRGEVERLLALQDSYPWIGYGSRPTRSSSSNRSNRPSSARKGSKRRQAAQSFLNSRGDNPAPGAAVVETQRSQAKSDSGASSLTTSDSEPSTKYLEPDRSSRIAFNIVPVGMAPVPISIHPNKSPVSASNEPPSYDPIVVNIKLHDPNSPPTALDQAAAALDTPTQNESLANITGPSKSTDEKSSKEMASDSEDVAAKAVEEAAFAAPKAPVAPTATETEPDQLKIISTAQEAESVGGPLVVAAAKPMSREVPVDSERLGKGPTDPIEKPVISVHVTATTQIPTAEVARCLVAPQTEHIIEPDAVVAHPSEQQPIVDKKAPAAPSAEHDMLPKALRDIQTASLDRHRGDSTNAEPPAMLSEAPRFIKRSDGKDTSAIPPRVSKQSPRNKDDAISGEQQTKLGSMVMEAAGLVAMALHNGPWPSPHRSLSPSDTGTRGEDAYTAHTEHVSIVGASLVQYSRDVVAPAFMSEVRGPPNAEKANLGTWLLLREVMCQNAESIFGPSAFITGHEEDFSDNEDEGLDPQAVGLFSVTILVTSIILSAIESLPAEANPDELGTKFLEMAEACDRGDDEFVQFLKSVDESVKPRLPSQQELGEEERMAWQVTINMQRDRHRMLTEYCKRKYEQVDDSEDDRVLPKRNVAANAVHITILEEQKR